jgi:hypothetical protein
MAMQIVMTNSDNQIDPNASHKNNSNGISTIPVCIEVDKIDGLNALYNELLYFFLLINKNNCIIRI